MSERPLLLLPTPEKASRSGLGGGSGHVRTPTAQRQWDRLSPIFEQLKVAFEARRVDLQQTAIDTVPEQVLVIETIGSIEDFAKAVNRIEGLEWMGEVEIDDIAPDKDFFDESSPEKGLSGRLYLIISNQTALDQMLSLWRLYQANPEMKFERGLTRFRDVFLHLKNIRRWDIQDRLLETGVIAVWQEELEFNGERVIPFEAELWFRGSPELRTTSSGQFTELVQRAGGRVLSQSIIEGIAYHGLLAELPADAIRLIVANPATELVKCENVMFFRPAGQIVVGRESPEGELETAPIGDMPSPTGEPVVALLDGAPLANHRLLSGRVRVDDPESWEAEYAASERIHGTSMASLIVHGDLNQPASPLSRTIYVRPIMKPNPRDFGNLRSESVPEGVLLADLIHRCVIRLFEGDSAEGPVAPNIKIINLSLGDPARQFTHFISPVARLLDWLSAKYGVLFVVSAGNHPSPIALGISRNEFQTLQPNEREAVTIKALYRDARNRRLLSPAETINGLTVGAVHHDDSQGAYPGNRFDPFEQPLPSPVSAFGSGYRRAIKPDVVHNGGKQWYRLPSVPAEPLTIEPAIFRAAPGNKVASPGTLAGELTATSYSCGTSNATALVSRAAAICHDSLQQIFHEQAAELDPRIYVAPLLKTMLVHSCSWRDSGSRITDVLRTPENGREIRGLICRWLGYGMPQIDRVLACTYERGTLLGFGQLSNGEAHVFRLPLPPTLGSRPEWRRLTVTMAWLSPISANTHRYRTASLWFEVGGVTPAKDRKDSCGGSDGWRAVRRGTVQHEVFEGQLAEPFIDGNVVEIKVNCREDAGKIPNPVAYGLTVSLEVAEGVDIAVYDEIRTRITPAILIQPATGLGGG